MIKNIYLHIGLHKTGSTSIQESLGKSAEYLKANGYLYPIFQVGNRSICNHSIPFFSMFTSNPLEYVPNLANGINTNNGISELHQGYIGQFAKQLKNFEGNKLIISGEGISKLDKEQLENLKRFLWEQVGCNAQITVIVYLRNPLAALVSRLQGAVRQGHNLMTLTNDQKYLTHDYFQKVISNSISVFGVDQVKLVKFEDAIRHANGPVGRFLFEIGIGLEMQQHIVYERANQSIGYEALVLLSAINENVPRFVENVNNIERNGYIQQLIYKIPGQMIRLSDKFNHKIWELAQPDMEWLSSNFDIEPYRFPEFGSVMDCAIWDHNSISFVAVNMGKQPVKIQQLICREMYFEMCRYYKVMNADHLIGLIDFIKAHRQLLDHTFPIPDLPKGYKLFFRLVGAKGFIARKVKALDLEGRLCRWQITHIIQSGNELLKTELSKNIGLFGW